MMKILVTGSNGLLGQKLTDLLISTPGVSLIATGKGANRHPLTTGYVYEEMDVTDQSKLEEVISKYEPDFLIHTAAVTHVDVAEANKDLAFAINVRAVENLAFICAREGIHFIHLSTDFVFDGLKGPYREDDIPNPLSYYGETKYLAEKKLMASGAKWTIIRTILVYGVIQDASRSNIVLWAKNALLQNDPISVVNDQWRMPTLAEDLAMACLLVANNRATGIYHVSGRDMMSVLEIVYRVAEFWNLETSGIRPVSSKDLNQSAARPSRTGFILDKAMTELRYFPHSFEEGLVLVDSQLKAMFS